MYLMLLVSLLSLLFVPGFTDSKTPIEGVEQAFKRLQIVEDVLDTAPSKVIEVKYNDLKVNLGNELTPTQVKNVPTSIIWNADSTKFYTLLMIDPDAPSRKTPTYREWLHWSVVNIPGNNLAKGETLADYRGAGPPRDTGLHRYVILAFQQPSNLTFDEPRLSSTTRENRPKFSTRKFVSKYKLELVAGNFFQAKYEEQK